MSQNDFFLHLKRPYQKLAEQPFLNQKNKKQVQLYNRLRQKSFPIRQQIIAGTINGITLSFGILFPDLMQY